MTVTLPAAITPSPAFQPVPGQRIDPELARSWLLVNAATPDAFAPALASIDGFATWGGFGGLTLTAGADYDGSGGDEKWRRREVRLTKDLFSSAIRLTANGASSPNGCRRPGASS